MCDTVITLGFFETSNTKLTRTTVQRSSLSKTSGTWTSQFGLCYTSLAHFHIMF